MRGRSNGDIIKVLYDHKRHVEALVDRIEKLESEVKALRASRTDNVEEPK